MLFGLIMAGGSGTRFWPKSRHKTPKQLLRIYGEKSMIQNTVDRLKPLIEKEGLFIVTTEAQTDEIKKQLPFIPNQNIIVEPKGKNTAPCIGLSALYMEKIDPEGVMVVVPADHLIQDNEIFIQTLKAGVQIATEKDCLVTIGIQPSYPSTGYGYIQYNDEVANINGVSICRVKTFAEKPNLETARRFLESGEFLWNSGIFIWKVKTILREIEEYLPHLYDGLLEIKAALGTEKENQVIERVYCQIKSISIDYGVMEHAKNVLVLKGQFGWNDLGSWDEVYKLYPKDENENALIGQHIVIDAKGCYVDAPDKLVAVLGVNDLIVVDTKDALLICRRDRAQDVKEIVDLAKRKKLDQYL
ncbi:MAG: mannose-1-phosphate guanylyltransferase [Calditrichaeota bacterium]|nr:MAG: mannose-1-phosphate guanylyltransferase [Calditrichota bacterium]